MTNPEFIPAVLALASEQISQSIQHPHHALGGLVRWILDQYPGRGAGDMFTVVLLPGSPISEHEHPEDVVAYYAEPAGVPVIVAGTPITPRPGEIVLIPRGSKHSVPPNTSRLRRVSVALKLV